MHPRSTSARDETRGRMPEGWPTGFVRFDVSLLFRSRSAYRASRAPRRVAMVIGNAAYQTCSAPDDADDPDAAGSFLNFSAPWTS